MSTPIPATPAAVPAAPGADSGATSPAPVDATRVAMQAAKDHIAGGKRLRERKKSEWKQNVDDRLGTGSIGSGDLTADQSPINPNWALTKTKTANLYSQVPTVQLTHESAQYAAAIPPFAKALNYELSDKRTDVGVAMEERLNDVVNASGVAGAVVGYLARTKKVKAATQQYFVAPTGEQVDTAQMTQDQLLQLEAAKLLTLQDVETVSDYKFFVDRISPNLLLLPDNFTGSNFDNADGVGYSGTLPWGVAKGEFHLTDAQKDQVTGEGDDKSSATLRADNDSRAGGMELVRYDRWYYWRHRVDPDEPSLCAIWEIVFVAGIEEPVIHEAWKGQQYDPQTGKVIGAKKFPVRVLTLTYVSDNPIVPSDTKMGRPQVEDMRRSRTQMFENRKRSVPIRWADTNRIDPLVMDNLMKGEMQGFIPTNGDGTRSIGEIARASYPSEDLAFDRFAKEDLNEVWMLGPNQRGTISSGKHTAAEAEDVQQNFATIIGFERNKVAKDFLSICEVLAGLMVLYSDFPNLSAQERQAMQQAWDQKHILHDLVFKIRPDSAIVLETGQRIDRLMKFLNMTVQSGFVNPKPVITEIAELSGVDPADVIIDPTPKKPEDPNISYRFTGKDDLSNPVVVAMLIKQGEAPGPQDIENAKKLLTAAQMPLQPPAPPQGGPQGPPVGVPGAPDAAAPPSGSGGATAGPGAPQAHPGWELAPKIASRSRDI